jgi:hypothetical protein
MNQAPPLTPEVVAPEQQAANIEARANQQVAKVMQDQRLFDLIKKASQVQVYLQFNKIENATQYEQAKAGIGYIKQAFGDAETFCHEVVDVYKAFTSKVDALFKNSVKDPLKKAEDHLKGLVEAKDKADRLAEEEAKRAQAAATAAGQMPMLGENGEVMVGSPPSLDGGSPLPPSMQPGNAVESARVSNAPMEQNPVGYAVEDLKAFLKIVAGTNKRYTWLQDHADELIMVNLGVLKRLVDEKGRVKSVPGIIIGR